MRIIAAIYLTIMLVNCGLWLANGQRIDIFASPYHPLIYGLYIFGLLALLAYVLRVRLLPRRAWQGVLVVYVGYRLLELATNGLVLDGGDPVIGLNAVSNYLWLVVPPGLAMWYLGFMPFAGASLNGQHPPKQGPRMPERRYS